MSVDSLLKWKVELTENGNVGLLQTKAETVRLLQTETETVRLPQTKTEVCFPWLVNG
jgi:hypothetical protein